MKRNDGLYPVYIRVAHNDGLQYIKTGFLVDDKGLRVSYSKSGKKSVDVSDRNTLRMCSSRITGYVEKINLMDIRDMNCKTLVDAITDKNVDLSFTEYADEHIKWMKKKGMEGNSSNYEMAIKRLKEYLKKDNILFKELTSRVVQAWIDSMSESARKKSLYPSCVRAIFKVTIKKFNDPEQGIVRIRFNPFDRVQIPADEAPEKRSVDADIIKQVLTSDITYPKSHEKISREEIGRDVGMIIFCLAGINAADLYDLKTDALKVPNSTTVLNGTEKLCYHRKKTRKKSKTGAYMEITIPEAIRPLFEKYKGKDGMLFMFSERFVDRAGFVKNVNKGLKWICEEIELLEMPEDDPRKRKKEKAKKKNSIPENTEINEEIEKPKAEKKEYILKKPVTTYTFRHSWATIAQNNCGASTEMVAFALNHASVHKITEGYIRKDYTPIDELNKKVIEFVFGVGNSDEPLETKKADT